MAHAIACSPAAFMTYLFLTTASLSTLLLAYALLMRATGYYSARDEVCCRLCPAPSNPSTPSSSHSHSASRSAARCCSTDWCCDQLEVTSRRLHRCMCCCCAHVFEPANRPGDSGSIWDRPRRSQLPAGASAAYEQQSRSSHSKGEWARVSTTELEMDEKAPVPDGLSEHELINLQRNLFTV
jgi:hypothetical protein